MLIPLYMFFFSPCKLARKVCVVYYPMYIALTNGSSFFFRKEEEVDILYRYFQC